MLDRLIGRHCAPVGPIAQFVFRLFAENSGNDCFGDLVGGDDGASVSVGHLSPQPIKAENYQIDPLFDALRRFFRGLNLAKFFANVVNDASMPSARAKGRSAPRNLPAQV